MSLTYEDDEVGDKDGVLDELHQQVGVHPSDVTAVTTVVTLAVTAVIKFTETKICIHMIMNGLHLFGSTGGLALNTEQASLGG